MKFMQAPSMRGALGTVTGVLAGFVVSLPIVVFAGGLLPIVQILAPMQNQTVSGYVTFLARADSAGLVGLRFQVDGQDFGSEVTSGVCRAIWDSTQNSDGLHTIQAVGRDQYGNLTLAQPVTVLVSNPPFIPPAPAPAPAPTPTPAPGPDTAQTVTVTAPVAGVSVTGTAVSVATTFPAETDFLTYFLLDLETSVVRWMTRGPLLERTQTSSSFTVNASVVPAGSYDLQVVARLGSIDVASPRVRLSFASPPAPTPTPTPTPAPSLFMSLGTIGGRDFTLMASLALNGIASSGVPVTFVVTSPQGARSTYYATTSSVGMALIQARLTTRDPRGTYRVTATASTSGLTATASGSFIY